MGNAARTSQKLNEPLTEGLADGDARAELLKLAAHKIVEEALEAEVGEALGRGYYDNGAGPSRAIAMPIAGAGCVLPRGPIDYCVPRSSRAPRSRSCRAYGPASPAARRS